jgi:hypothetical protein
LLADADIAMIESDFAAGTVDFSQGARDAAAAAPRPLAGCWTAAA